MHIAFFNRSYYPDQTATGQLLTDLCEDLVRDHGCRVSVVTGPPLNPLPGLSTAARGIVTREEHAGVTIHRAGGTRFDKRRFAGRATNYMTYFASACYAGLRLDRPDVVVALTDPPIIGLAAWLAGRRHRAPLVMAFKDLFPEVAALLPDFHSDTINRALQQVNRFLVRRAAVNVALSETMRRRLIDDKGAPPERTIIIPDWADTFAVSPGPKRNAFSESHGLADVFVVMHSGNLGLSQSLETVVDAAARLREVGDLLFVFQGEGVSKPVLEARVRELGLSNVLFLPFAPKAALSDSFASADVFIVSLQRGLAGYIVPSKLYGILAAGRPYVAAVEERCEVASLTRAADSGIVVDPGDARQLADAVMAFHGDRDRTARCGANARAVGLSFDRRLQVSRYMETFRAVQAPRRGGDGLFAKRVFDATVAGAGLLVSLPLWALIAAAVKLEDGGPIFYSQDRAGRHGRPFRVYKFRSMIPDAEAQVGARQATAADARITRVGRWLRATAMDELPQLWSIVRGDMSFVGPRALRPGEIEVVGDGRLVALEAVPGYALRSQVVPGLTGVAQIYAPRDVARRQKFRYDRIYIRQQSLWLDLRLIVLSFWITFRGTWEVRGRKF
jgi:lipopolysaccharide/colanic/teichoic acid biosynthesis glycosyltransferase